MRYTSSTDLAPCFFWNGLFYEWNGSSYEARVDADIRAAIGSFLANEVDLETVIRSTKNGTKSVIVPPCSKHKNEILDALKTSDIYRLADALTPPQWLDGTRVSNDVIAVANGLLNLSTCILSPSTPLFFNLNAIDVAYDPDGEVFELATVPRRGVSDQPRRNPHYCNRFSATSSRPILSSKS